MTTHPSTTDALVEVSSTRSVGQRLRDIWAYRGLLRNLISRQVRVRYKGSLLGVFWSLLSPAMYLVVYSIVFQVILEVNVPRFGVFMLSGLVVWNFFSTSMSTAAASIVQNAPLVQKVWFPREVLPLAAVGAALVDLALQSGVLVLGMIAFRHPPDLGALWLLPIALVVVVVLAVGLGLGLAALNVGHRDVQHLLDVGLLAWFWVSVIVYPYADVARRLGDAEPLSLLNPLIPIVITFQRIFHNPDPDPAVLLDVGPTWYLGRLAVVALVAAVALVWGFRTFARLEDDFGEQL